MSKNAVVSDFMREAVREKASRELAGLQQKTDAIGGVERARDALHAVGSDLATAAPAILAVASDTAIAGKLKKLRKLVEEAHVLATDLGDTLGIEEHRQSLESSREAILEALKSAGIDPATVLTVPGGDAQ